MDENEIQEFADENKLDVREMQPFHFRLMDNYGKYVLDIYIGRKKGKIVRNPTLVWKTNKWHRPQTIKDLKKLLN